MAKLFSAQAESPAERQTISALAAFALVGIGSKTVLEIYRTLQEKIWCVSEAPARTVLSRVGIAPLIRLHWEPNGTDVCTGAC